MKIGILTYHKAHNYGAILQALATRKVLQSLGYEAYYVDYYPEYHRNKYVPFSLKEMINRKVKLGWKYLVSYIKFHKLIKQRYDNFETFINRNVVPYCKPLSYDFDLVIYGSDQIWRKQNKRIGYNPIYFGSDVVKATRKISFAASMGELSTTEVDKAQIRKLCGNFDALSVREKSLCQFLKELGFKKVSVNIDPTLLIESRSWNEYISTKRKESNYVLLYNLQKDAFDINQVKSFADKIGCKLVILQGSVDENNENIDSTSGPSEFLSLIKGAKCVFSSSFHGVAFSIIFGKPFYASLNFKADRVKNLLETLEIGKCFIDGHHLSGLSLPDINYKMVYLKLSKLKDESFSYLSSQINNVNINRRFF